MLGRRHRARMRAIPLGKWPAIVTSAVKESARDRITMIAASLAFHGFLALLPILIAAVGLLGLVGLSPSALHSLLHATSVLLPSQMSQVLNEQLVAPASRQLSIVELALGLAVALWSSVEAMSALQVALDVAYEVPRDRGFVGRRIVALPLIGVTVLLGGIASVLLLFGDRVATLLPSAFALVRPEFHDLLQVIRYGGSLLLVMLLLSAYYSFGPAHSRPAWEWVSPGSIVAAIGWVAAAAGFSFYLDHFGHESRSYGGLAGVAVTLLWMFLTGVVILFGAELNRELERLEGAHGNDAPARPEL
jgi:membrane protein